MILDHYLFRNVRMDLLKPYFDGLEQLEQQKQAAEAKILQVHDESDGYADVCAGIVVVSFIDMLIIVQYLS